MARFLSRLTLAGLVLFITALPLQAADQVTLTWTAGGAGGGWYGMAGGIATVVNQANPDIVIKVIPGGGVQNPALVANKSAEIGWGLPFMNAAAYKGMAPFEKPLTELRALAGGMSMNFFHLYVGAEIPVDDTDQFFAQPKFRMALSQAGSSEAWVFEQILAAYGETFNTLSDKGFHFARGNYSFQANQFKDKNVNGVFTFLALPGAAVTEASVGRDLKLVHFSDMVLHYLDQFGIVPGEIPVGTYPKAANTTPVRTAKSGSVITVHQDMPEELAYQITKIFNENLDKVHQIHASLATYEVKDGPTGCGVPLHPGAERYYREAGVLQ
ncbi:MAG: TAXI family TRAP transporter solute-binding subunit [Deltaproteobacteria bacterium]|nr:TAXI family TRAP transporter solute-binding subunit [Deltaproteobacteria bacterium]MBW2356024.1 TAXI family TRAP transporter solute-binding subunit [Deltaproteobacteria bacterium]